MLAPDNDENSGEAIAFWGTEGCLHVLNSKMLVKEESEK